MSNKKAVAPELTNADVEVVRTSLEEQLGEQPTNGLDVLEQVANTAPPKKPPTTATKSEPKHCAKEGCKLYAQQPSEFCSNHKPAVERLSYEERERLVVWIDSLTQTERLVAFVQAFGPVKSKQLAQQFIEDDGKI